MKELRAKSCFAKNMAVRCHPGGRSAVCIYVFRLLSKTLGAEVRNRTSTTFLLSPCLLKTLLNLLKLPSWSLGTRITVLRPSSLVFQRQPKLSLG